MRKAGTGPGLALPGEPCRVPPHESWSELEKWVWQEVGSGRIADINAKLGETADPKRPEDWGADRRVSHAFLETMLLHDPWRSAIPRRGVRISGALFDQKVELEEAELRAAAWFNNSLFTREVILTGLRAPHHISFQGSRIADTLNMYEATTGTSLLLGGAEFAEVILTGVKIGGLLSLRGAKVLGKLDLDAAEIGDSLIIDKGADLQKAFLRSAKVAKQLTLSGAKVRGSLNLNSTSVGGSLFLDEGGDFTEVSLRGARIGGNSEFNGARFAGTLDMDSVSIAGSLLMGRNAELGHVVLRAARIDGQLSLAGAASVSSLNMDSASVGASVLALGRIAFGDVLLRGTQIRGNLELDGIKLSGDLSAGFVSIGQSLFMRFIVGTRRADLLFAHIGGNLDLRGATLTALDLTGAKIEGELTLASGDCLPIWKDGGYLKLRNARAGAIQDEPTAWPMRLDLDGFNYSRFGGGATSRAAQTERGTEWFKAWLARDEPYTPQPYHQCAKVLREMGNSDMADDVLYAGRERDRKQALRSGNNPRATGLALLKWFIGYGYGSRLLWRPLAWVVAFTAIGTVVLHLSPCMPKELAGSLDKPIFFSFDLLLPIIQLYEPHYDIVLDGVTRYYFAFHKLMGYVLASFLIAGLAGLTK